TAEYAIRNFDSARLTVSSLELIEPLLTQVLGYELVEHKENLYLFAVPDMTRAAYLEVEVAAGPLGATGAGTVHHIAFTATTEDHQLQLRDTVMSLGLHPTTVIDRYYFKSVYFRTPAGILFELATEGPGFTADEKEAVLGQKLALPPFLEDQREDIEATLPPINLHG
ncbi:MAG TPA: VOC family protein, partial [Patescibacteria group bacterium]